jgi:hypothetical protein
MGMEHKAWAWTVVLVLMVLLVPCVFLVMVVLWTMVTCMGEIVSMRAQGTWLWIGLHIGTKSAACSMLIHP